MNLEIQLDSNAMFIEILLPIISFRFSKLPSSSVDHVFLHSDQPPVIIWPTLWSNLKGNLGQTLWSTISQLDQLTSMLMTSQTMCNRIIWPVKFDPHWSRLANSFPMVIQSTKCRMQLRRWGYVGLVAIHRHCLEQNSPSHSRARIHWKNTFKVCQDVAIASQQWQL